MMSMVRSIALVTAVVLATGRFALAQETAGTMPVSASVSATPPISAAAARDQIAAATGRAVDSLRAQITSEPIGNGLTVQDLLDKTRSTHKFMQTLRRAQQIGGPRWLDPQTCQVRLEIGGPTVAKALYTIAATDNRTPVPADVVQAKLQGWDRRTFSATGTSTGAAAVESAVADKVHRQAVCDARQDAVNQVLQSIRPIPLAKGKTVADALANEKIRGEVEQWLGARPVTRIEFRDDPQPQARVTLAVAGDELFDVFRAAAQKQANTLPPMDEATWSRVRDDFIARVAPAAGRAVAPSAASELGTAPVIRRAIPQTPPEWVNQLIEAQGTSLRKGNSSLKTARAAETDAVNKLRDKVETLALAPGQTLGDAAKLDKQIAQAIDRALHGAATTKVDYRPDGGAAAIVSLDLRDLWHEIQSSP